MKKYYINSLDGCNFDLLRDFKILLDMIGLDIFQRDTFDYINVLDIDDTCKVLTDDKFDLELIKQLSDPK